MMQRLVRNLTDSIEGGKPFRVPEPCRMLWGWFADLTATRTWHAHGPNPITYCEIEAYARLNGIPIRPQDVAAIRRLDAAWLSATLSKLRQGAAPGGGSAATEEINPALFDAVFG